MTGERRNRMVARKEGCSSVTLEEMKEWVAAVPAGVCVTLPNGLVIDKKGQWNQWPYSPYTYCYSSSISNVPITSTTYPFTNNGDFKSVGVTYTSDNSVGNISTSM